MRSRQLHFTRNLYSTWRSGKYFKSPANQFHSSCINRDNERGVLKLNSLTNILIETIKTTGPISLSLYMRQCLTNPQYGYYTTLNEPLGSRGDFITSPEISSIFGESVGVWCYATWLMQGKPKLIQLIEFGPGLGTMMNDVVRIFEKLNKDPIDLKIVMVELSEKLRQQQYEKLCNVDESFLMKRDSDELYESVTKSGRVIEWVETEKDIVGHENYANYILAHEFFDALPIKQFKKTEHGWREYLVDYDHDSEDRTPFRLVLSPYETPSSKLTLDKRFHNCEEGAVVEICPEGYTYGSKMSEIINSNIELRYDPLKKGGILICDYGPEDHIIPQGTLRGIKNHKFVSPWSLPGECDLSVDVDFGNLSKIFTENGCISYGPVEQGDWLHELGIGYRVDQLLSTVKDETERQNLIMAYKRLVDEDQMGKTYKFLGVLPGGSQGVFPVGFGGGVIEP